jgi:nucleoside 2-deoxyribosyltransferase
MGTSWFMILSTIAETADHPVIEELEARIGKPVVTSTQAALWRLLRLAGVDTLIDGFGRLMQEFQDAHSDLLSCAEQGVGRSRLEGGVPIEPPGTVPVRAAVVGIGHMGGHMLQDEYNRLAKTIGYVTDTQTNEIINIALSKIKRDARAGIVEIWRVRRGMGDVGILDSYFRLANTGIPDSRSITLDAERPGLLAWVVEKRKPVWINDITPGAASGRNIFDNEIIEGRYFNLYEGTRAFAAVPIESRDQLNAILAVEVTDGHSRLEKDIVDILRYIAEATGILMWKANVTAEHEKQANEAITYFRDSINNAAVRRLALHKTGFISRPFSEDFALIADIIKNAFGSIEVQATEYRPMAGREYVVEEMVEQINSAHFGIADITSLNANVLIETGLMIGINKPMIMLRDKRDVQPIPFNIRARQVLRYYQQEEQVMIQDATKSTPLNRFITEFIKGLERDNREFGDARPWYGG